MPIKKATPSKPSKEKVKKKPAAPAKTKTVKPKPAAKPAPKSAAKPAPKAAPKTAEPKHVPAKKATAKKPATTKKAEFRTPQKIDSVLMIQGAKFVKTNFFFDSEKEYGNKYKHGIPQKLLEKPTASSRLKISGPLDGKNLVEILSQQLEYENRTYFEGCEGQICVKCNRNNVDPKFYVDKSLGHCTECAELLGLGQSKEGVFSDAQMELMRRSIEKSMENTKNIDDEDDIESALLGDIDSLEQEELLAIVEEAEP